MADVDSRVVDFLDDKLQTFADFDSLDSLLQNVEAQQKLLKQQLDAAHKDLAGAREASAHQAKSAQQKGRIFQQDQQDLDRRLRIITQSDTGDDALEQFRSRLDKLHRLEVASGYVETLQEVKRLSKNADSKLQSSPENSLAHYSQLRRLASTLHGLRAETEGAAPHLVDHVEDTCLSVRSNIVEALTADLEKVLGKFLWPKPGVEVPEKIQDELDTAVGRLLELQKPELELNIAGSSSSRPQNGAAVLIPLEVMARPLEKRFHYHFSGNRPTNRLDKPEYFFAHIIDLLNSHSTFMEDHVQPIILRRFSGSELVLEPAYVDAISAFITALLPMIRTKLLAVIPQLTSQPQLLSHLVHELISFDNTLREDWRYTASRASDKTQWKGISWEILVQHDWFGRWLEVEKDFALARYDAIEAGQDSFTLDFDSVDQATSKPTKAAMRVKDLLETVTERYRPLTSFSQKLRFLIDIQLTILDRFHAKLHSSLEAFLTMTSSIGRTVQGVSAADLANLQGINGLDRLCRVFGSADLLEKAMRDWSDDVFFLDLWSELQYRAASARSGTLVAGPLSVADIASRTSSALAPQDDADAEPDDLLNGALFDESASAYERLRARAESVITETVVSSTRDSLRPYIRGNPFSSLSTPASSDDPDDTPTTPSPDLANPIKSLSTVMSFLAKALGSLPLRRVRRQVSQALDTYLFDRVILGHSFSARGAKQVWVDVQALCEALDAPLKKCGEGVTLLGLEMRGEAEETESTLGLSDVEKRLFADNESAREVLDELGVEYLSENEARQVLQRRVELGR